MDIASDTIHFDALVLTCGKVLPAVSTLSKPLTELEEVCGPTAGQATWTQAVQATKGRSGTGASHYNTI